MVTILGASIHELIRNKTANSLGYHSYSFHFGELWFENDSLWEQIKPIREANLESIKAHKPFPDKDKLDTYYYQNMKGKALIESSAKAFIFSISFLGIIMLFIRRKKRNKKFEIIDWIGVILALFIMKQVFISTLFILSGMEFCDYAAFAQYFHLPLWRTERDILIFGLIVSIFIVFRVIPKDKRVPFFFSGLAGGLLGICLWYFAIGKVLFG